MSWKLPVTFGLSMILIMIGFVLLIIPGLVLATWYWFAMTVVVLERLSGYAALKRSKELGKDFFWRNVRVASLLTIVIYVPAFVGGIVLTFIAYVANLPLALGMVAGITLFHILAPILFIGIILLYYDMRARKEGYDITTLAEDLQH
jgi:hypothetical protein